MGFWQSKVLSVPKATWLLISLCIVLAAEIAAALSFAFLHIVFPSFSLNEESLILFLVSVSLVSLLVGLPAWWMFVRRPRQTTLRRGILLGMLGGILSSIVVHPLVWICCILLSYFLGVDFIVHQTEHNLLLMFLFILPFPILSLSLVGWITATVGGITGGLLVYLQTVLNRQQDDNVSLPKG